MLRLVGLACLVGCGAAGAAAELEFEAEAWTTPVTAWQVDKFADDRWNLWSTDQNAAAKWSGGVVLQSPVVKADRATPEEGAPPLHTVITGLPAGTYDVFMNSTRALGLSFDGQTWQRSTGGLIATNRRIADGRFELWVDDRYVNTENPGSAYFDFLAFEPLKQVAPKPAVTGFAKTRVVESLDRGLVAVTGPDGVYVGWRLLPGDPADLGFNVYRQAANGAPVKVNAAPVTKTCDLLDTAAPETGLLTYTVRPVRAGQEAPAEGTAQRQETDYVSLKLDGDHTFQKCGLGDLDGDGRLDYVVKQPGANIDPYKAYWHKSPGTYQLEAYSHNGQLLWRHDMGWAIEQGIWYSPYLVYDFDGDGRAEVAVKTGEGDPRDADGRVFSGPEWVTILDGRTGQERCRVPWPSREGFGEDEAGYNYAARNQLAVAYLDGKTPCLIVLRGTYTVMKAEAWQLVGNRLEPLWTYSSEEGSRRLRGQGAHFTQAVDLDGDGRDEVVLGSLVLDDTGVPLWSTGLGHPDHLYIGDHDPRRPGMEIYFGVETRQAKHGMCLADAKTGEILWGWDQPTGHVHGTGLCSDIDPTEPGAEMYGADSIDHKPNGEPWLWSSSGKILSRELNWSFGRNCVWWDADLQREVLVGTSPVKFGGRPAPGLIAGSVVLVADVLGDWREEVVTAVAGELRINTTTIPAMDRRTTLLADPLYRLDAAMCAMGYTQVPTLQACLEAISPNLNLTVLEAAAGQPNLRLVASAPMDRGIRGQLTLQAAGGTFTPASFAVDLQPGERTVLTALAKPAGETAGELVVTAHLAGAAVDLTTTVRLASGLQDGGFERAAGGKPVGWTWWSRETGGEAVIDRAVVHGGRSSAFITHQGERDWAFSNTERLAVKPGTQLRVRGWAKSEAAGSTELAIVALSGGQTVTWSIGGAKASGTFDWRLVEGTATVPDGVDQVYVRWVGAGAAKLHLDDTALMVVEP